MSHNTIRVGDVGLTDGPIALSDVVGGASAGAKIVSDNGTISKSEAQQGEQLGLSLQSKQTPTYTNTASYTSSLRKLCWYRGQGALTANSALVTSNAATTATGAIYTGPDFTTDFVLTTGTWLFVAIPAIRRTGTTVLYYALVDSAYVSSNQDSYILGPVGRLQYTIYARHQPYIAVIEVTGTRTVSLAAIVSPVSYAPPLASEYKFASLQITKLA